MTDVIEQDRIKKIVQLARQLSRQVLYHVDKDKRFPLTEKSCSCLTVARELTVLLENRK